MASSFSGPTWFPGSAQGVVAGLTAASLAAVGAWFLAAGGLEGDLVDHDSPPAATVVFTVDLNTASAEELAQLPGLGPALAGRIVAGRRVHGPFSSAAGLLDVPGIGPATLARLTPHLRPFEPDAAAADEGTR